MHFSFSLPTLSTLFLKTWRWISFPSSLFSSSSHCWWREKNKITYQSRHNNFFQTQRRLKEEDLGRRWRKKITKYELFTFLTSSSFLNQYSKLDGIKSFKIFSMEYYEVIVTQVIFLIFTSINSTNENNLVWNNLV